MMPNNKKYLALFLCLFLFVAMFFAVEIKSAKAAEKGLYSKYLNIVAPGVGDLYSVTGAPDITKDAAVSGANDYILKPLLLSIFLFVKQLPIMGLSMLNWVLAPTNTTAILEHSIIYGLWSFIRDFINMLFVLLLLFSAFATIFQIEQYNYKKLLAKLIIAAFLINFSFPIARIFIDASNVLLYSLINFLSVALGKTPGDGTMTLLNASGYSQVVAAGDSTSTTSLIFAIIAVFLIGISFVAMSFLFLVRIFALVILIIFSPIAFVASAVPSAGKFGSMWWNNLLKYSFFAPIMIFFFYIAIVFMSALNTQTFSSLLNNTNNQSAGADIPPSALAGFVFCLIPVMIIWIGMGIANKFGIAGANETMGRAQKFAKWLPNAGFRATGVPGTYKKFSEDFKKTGKLFGKKIPLLGTEPREEREARWAAGLSGGLTAAQRVKFEQDRKKVKEASEKQEMETMNPTQLRDIINSSRNNFERAAAIQALAKKGMANRTDMKFLIDNFGGDRSQVFRQAQSDLKVFDPATAFAHIGNANAKREAIEGHIRSAQFDPKKLNANTLRNDEFMRIALQNQAISNKDLEDIAKKSSVNRTSVRNSLNAVAGAAPLVGVSNDERAANINIHLAHFAQTGELHRTLVTPADKATIIQNLDKENIKRISMAFLNARDAYGTRNLDTFINSLNTTKLKEMLQNITDENSRRSIANRIRGLHAANPGNPRYTSMERTLNHPDVVNIV